MFHNSLSNPASNDPCFTPNSTHDQPHNGQIAPSQTGVASDLTYHHPAHVNPHFYVDRNTHTTHYQNPNIYLTQNQIPSTLHHSAKSHVTSNHPEFQNSIHYHPTQSHFGSAQSQSHLSTYHSPNRPIHPLPSPRILQTNNTLTSSPVHLHRPIPANPNVVSQLEDRANQDRNSSDYRPSLSQCPSTYSPSLPPPLPSPHPKSHAPPLTGITDCTNSKKRKKIEPANRPRPAPRAYEEMMRMSKAELVIEAKNWSKKAMSNSDRTFFANYASQQRKMMSIKAIERGVSMPMVHGFLGRRMAVRNPNSFNYFMKTKNARAVFCGPRKGVKWSPGMGGVSGLWKKLSSEEQAKYRHLASTTTRPDGPSHPQNEDGSHEADEASDDDEPIVAANQVGMRKSILLLSSSKEVENFLDKWDAEAVNVAETFGFSDLAASIAMVNEQADKAAKAGSHAPGAKGGKDASFPLRPVSAVNRMSKLIAEKTGGAITQWPWSKTDYRLAEVKYQLELLPGAKVAASWLKRPSRGLTPNC
ncbi:hypothetical protein PtB15_16B57 [Puccinia triticina]|nr:hypothetical protein PtB15_16B57 [Puccinia triticina]